jgi:tagatose-6-phosphate ketose/aldose isomerase
VSAWEEDLVKLPEWGSLLEPGSAERIAHGYGHTLREILQQPETWKATARQISGAQAWLRNTLVAGGVHDGGSMAFTGSGSSLYAGECVALPVQASLGTFVQALPAGLLLTHAAACLPAGRPFLLVSLARSGNSPESVAAVDLLLETRPEGRHLILTCNGDGGLATRYADDARVHVLVLDERTNDKSLVMTSSFTNLVVAGGALGRLEDVTRLESHAAALASVAREVLRGHGSSLASCARGGFASVVYLGTGPSLAAAREAALKMLEMTAGQVGVLPESFLGLRHGPMSAVGDDTLVVAFLSPQPLARAYELDVLRELGRKGLGGTRVLVGEDLPPDLVRAGDVGVSPSGLGSLAEDGAAVIDVLVGQVLAFFRCRHTGLNPDAPSPDGVIHRVVEEFAIHRVESHR